MSLFSAAAAARTAQAGVEQGVDEAIRPLMRENDVPGMAVAVSVGGSRHFFNYGTASRESGQPVTQDTIFEIGSVSKTFTALLAAYAQVTGKLALRDKASQHLSALAGTRFDRISLADLGTYTAGGLPLQFPDEVIDGETMLAYFKGWRPTYAPGTHRLYSNPSIGLFGHLVAASLGRPFDNLMEDMMFPMLGLRRTFIKVPPGHMGAYASGYARDGKPIRVSPGVFDSQAYGVKTTADDLIRCVEANMDGSHLHANLQRAAATTHAGHYRVGEMTQGLGWEMYAYPTTLDELQSGNSREVMFEAHRVDRPRAALPGKDVLLNKTGSTNGFGAYVAFVPARRVGIVMLANRNYPIAARVKAAHGILTALDRGHSHSRVTLSRA